MHIAILGPIDTKSLFPAIKKKDIRTLPKGHGVSVLSQLALGLLELGHQVSVITLSNDINNNIVIYKNNKFKIYYCPLRKRAFRFNDGSIGRAANFWYQEIKFMQKALLNDNPQIVNAHWAYEYAFAAILAKKKYILTTRDIPHIILKYETTLYRLVRFIMAGIALKVSKNISTISNYAKLKTQLYTNRFIHVIPNPSIKDVPKLKIKKKLNKKIRIIMINNGFSFRKNIKIALKAFKEFNKNFSNSNLTLFGHGMERHNTCYTWAKKNCLIKNVIFRGSLDKKSLMKILPNYDIMLHTSLEESFGNIFLEAMMSGVPLIAGKNSGAAPEIVRGFGLLVDVNNIKEIINGLNKYALNPKLWSKIRVSAYKNVKKKYSQKNIVTKYLSLYKKILRK